MTEATEEKRGPVSFTHMTPAEEEAVATILNRAAALAARASFGFNRLTLLMDIHNVHARTPLRLEEWANADPANFAHDVVGIIRHMDRETGDLVDGFRPRFLQRVEVDA